MNQNNNKKLLAEKIKAKLNSSEYLAMPKLISREDWCPEILVWFPGKKDGWISTIDDLGINPTEKGREGLIYRTDLEENDWKEINDLIERKNQERRQIWEERKKNIETKLKNQANLYYHWGPNVKHLGDIGSIDWKGMRNYLQLSGGEGDLNDILFIAENHPVLDNFSFQVGFYLVDTNKQSEYSPRGNVCKFVEVSDQITITPYQVREKNETPLQKEIGFCNKCGADYQKIESWYYPLDESGKNSWEKLSWFCGKCWQIEEKNWRQKSSRKNTVYKNEPQKNNLGDEHYYFFENGQWISLESGTPDPNTANSEGKFSRLVTLVDHIQPPHEGKDKGNWDYFYYVFATENGERFVISALNPAIGFDAKDKKQEVFPRAGNNGVRYWYKISWKATEPDKRRFEKGDFIEIKRWWDLLDKNNEKEIINWLTQYFQENNIKSISLGNGELTITNNNNNNNNNNKVVADKNDPVQNIQGWLQKKGLRTLNRQDLNLSNPQTPSSNSPKPDYTPYLISGAFIVGIISLVAIGYYWGKKRTKKNN